MADAKKVKKSKRSKVNKVNKQDKKPSNVIKEDVAEKDDVQEEMNDFDSNSDIWPTIYFDSSSNDSDKQEEFIKEYRKRLREHLCKIIQKSTPALISFLREPIEEDKSKTIEKEKMEKNGEGTSEVPAKKPKKK